MRVSKTVNGATTNYYYEDGVLIAEERWNSDGNLTVFIYYLYDAMGIAGMVVHSSSVTMQNGVYYYFTKNLFGDIIGIKNAANELVGAYTYNAWGE